VCGFSGVARHNIFNKSSRFLIDSQFEGINTLEIKFAAANPQTETNGSALNTGIATRQAQSFAKACVC
jgi:hypothetical protein